MRGRHLTVDVSFTPLFRRSPHWRPARSRLFGSSGKTRLPQAYLQGKELGPRSTFLPAAPKRSG